MFNKSLVVLAAMGTRSAWTAMPLILAATSPRMATWAASIIPIVRAAPWKMVALSAAISCAASRAHLELLYLSLRKQRYPGAKATNCAETLVVDTGIVMWIYFRKSIW